MLTKEIESWRGFIDKLSSDEDKVVLTELLDSCHKCSIEINTHAQTHIFPESLIMALLLTQYKLNQSIEIDYAIKKQRT